MTTVRKSVIVPHSCEAMFDLVEHCERYPEFLPWCSAAEVFERTANITRARLDIDYHGLKSHISTVNRKEPPSEIGLTLVDGPFERFSGEWRFTPLGKQGCRVELSADYAMLSGALDSLLGPVFGHILETLVERFVERAAALEA
ncbi:MAG TPA: type II toxin-antitoxin system RatA family toxin [Usitatibacter sp.]|nr:type II toxin-antitoxin system RatA family toxin [Usitatibacter sp.]